jgi:outer membrane protein assembly factor BamD
LILCIIDNIVIGLRSNFKNKTKNCTFVSPSKKMKKLPLHIIFLISVIAFSCHSEKKVFESTSEKKAKKEKKGVALSKYNKLLKSNNAEAKYNAGVDYFNKKNYSKAIGLFEDVISVYRGTSKAPEVQYYYAFCSYNMGDYIVAGYQFRTFSKNFPNNEHAELCVYMGALCYYHNSPAYSLDQSETETAINELQKFVNQFPQNENVPECNKKLDELREKLEYKSYKSSMLYYNMGRYKSAIVAFNSHIKDFPETKYNEELAFLTMKCYYLLAVNSVESKKHERYKAAIDNYVKFVARFPKSDYLKEAEKIYTESSKFHERHKKLTS